MEPGSNDQNKSVSGHKIIVGRDDRIWFSNPTSGALTAISTTGVIQRYPEIAYQLTTGPDGTIWFLGFHRPGIGHLRGDGVIERFEPPNPGGDWSVPLLLDIVLGKDGNLWWSGEESTDGADEAESNFVVRMDVTGRVLGKYFIEHAVPISRASGWISAITSGPDGRIWGSMGRTYFAIDMQGDVRRYPRPTLAGTTGSGILRAGPRDRIWGADGNLGSVTLDGQWRDLHLSNAALPIQEIAIAPGPGRTLWVSATYQRQHSKGVLVVFR